MKCCVVYASRGGNTRKLAEQVAEELCCPLYDIETEEVPPEALRLVDVIFAGSGVYWNAPHRGLQKLDGLLRDRAARVALFFTWAGRGDSLDRADRVLRRWLSESEIPVLKGHFSCYGECFGLFRRGSPNREDLENVRAWARKTTGE